MRRQTLAKLPHKCVDSGTYCKVDTNHVWIVTPYFAKLMKLAHHPTLGFLHEMPCAGLLLCESWNQFRIRTRTALFKLCQNTMYPLRLQCCCPHCCRTVPCSSVRDSLAIWTYSSTREARGCFWSLSPQSNEPNSVTNWTIISLSIVPPSCSRVNL